MHACSFCACAGLRWLGNKSAPHSDKDPVWTSDKNNVFAIIVQNSIYCSLTFKKSKNTEILFQIIVAHVSTSVLSKVYTALRLMSKLLKNMRAYMVNSCFKVNSETEQGLLASNPLHIHGERHACKGYFTYV